MAILKLRGNGEHTELRDLADRMHGERSALEDLLTKAEGSSKQLGKLTEPIPKLTERLAALERQLSAIEMRVPIVGAVQDQVGGLLETQRQLESQLGESRDEVARLTAEIGELRRVVDTAGGLKRDLGAFAEMEASFRTLKGEAETLGAEMKVLTSDCRRLRENRDGLMQSAEEATTRLAAIGQASQAATRDLETHARRLEALEQRMEPLAQVAVGTADMKHQLLTVKSLADQVTQKAAALENQRDAIDRAARDVSRLDALVLQGDAAIRDQENQLSRLHTLATELADLKSVYESVAIRSKAISAHQQEIEERDRVTRQNLSDLSEQLGRATERFDAEHRGLETVTQRVTELKGAVKECEERIGRLDVASRLVTEVEGKADKTWTRLGFFMGELEKLNELPERMRILRADASRLHEQLATVSTRSAEVEKAKPVVEAAVRDLASLSGSHEAIKDALDQMRVAQEEIARARNAQTGTEGWLKTVQDMIADVQTRVREIDGARPTVDAVHRDVQRVIAAIDEVAERRQFLGDVHTRLGELAGLAAQLDDRTKAFRSRLDIAEGRFLMVTKQGEEADRIASLVATVAGTVARADGRVGDLNRTITSIEGRSQNLEALAERTRLLGVELEQRQLALDKASEHLTRASALRTEAADAVGLLDQRARSLQQTLAEVESRKSRLESLSSDLETYATRIRSVEAGMEEFAKQLGEWKVVKADLADSLTQLANRQATMDNLRQSIGQMFDLAERAAEDARTAADAQREIRNSKGTLDELLTRVHEADAVTAGLGARKQEIEQAEERLARAEALLIDIQASLETLNNEKALLDQVIEQSGTLRFQIQQAEGLIDRLRKERDITNTVRTAMEESGTREARRKR
jgi:chromosome segregation ATPase